MEQFHERERYVTWTGDKEGQSGYQGNLCFFSFRFVSCHIFLFNSWSSCRFSAFSRCFSFPLFVSDETVSFGNFSMQAEWEWFREQGGLAGLSHPCLCFWLCDMILVAYLPSSRK